MSSAVGKVTKLFGHDGGVVATLYDASEAINTEEPLFVIFDGLAVPLFIEHFERRGRSSALIRFMDIDSPNRAEMLLGKELLSDGEVWYNDHFDNMAGWTAIIGDLTAIVTAFIESGKNPLLQLEIDGREVLVPVAFVKNIDHPTRTVTLVVPDGLLELNA